jgi:uncharacterized protein
MNPREFTLNPARYGLPTREELVALRIWDAHYHGFNDGGSVAADAVIQEHEKMLFFTERLGIERLIALDIGAIRADALTPSPVDAEQRALLERQADRLSGVIRIDPSDPDASCARMKRWIADGPCIGIKYAYFNRAGIRCSHANSDPILRYARELDAYVYVCCWQIVGGNPRRPGGGNRPAESTPQDVTQLARRFPDVPIVCGHSGGDWELAVPEIRRYKNVYLEFAGSDPHSGSVDYAVRELGADRITWGGHGPSRSYATELSKVFDADLSHADRAKVLGGNIRRFTAPIFKRKGRPIQV